MIDGYIAGSSVFADLNGNGVMDPEEPSGTTDDAGNALLVLPAEYTGSILAIGGTDIATGLELYGTLKAPSGSGVISPVSTIVTELVERGQSRADAERAVKSAFGLSDSLDLLSTDPIAAILTGDRSARALLESFVQIQNLVVQVGAMVEDAVSGAGGDVSSERVIAALASKVEEGERMELSVSQTVESILSQTVSNIDSAPSGAVLRGAAELISATNEEFSSAFVSLEEDGFETLLAVSQVQAIAFGEGALRLREVTAGSAAIDSVVNEFTGNQLRSRIENVTVASPTGNEPPNIASIADQVIDEDHVIEGLAIELGDVDTDASQLRLHVASSNPSLFDERAILIDGFGFSRRLTLTPEKDAFGSSEITVTVNDGSLSSTTSFEVQVNPVNDPPTISSFADLHLEYGETRSISFTVNDPDDEPDRLFTSLASTDRTLVDAKNFLVLEQGIERTFTLKPSPGKSGQARIIVGVSDGSEIVTTSFEVVVAEPPSLLAPLIQVEGDIIVLSWAVGLLMEGKTISGPFRVIEGAASPYQVDIEQGAMRFYRVVTQ